MAPVTITVKANTIASTDLQRLADRVLNAVGYECNKVDVEVVTTITQPTEVVIRPNPSGFAHFVQQPR